MMPGGKHVVQKLIPFMIHGSISVHGLKSRRAEEQIKWERLLKVVSHMINLISLAKWEQVNMTIAFELRHYERRLLTEKSFLLPFNVILLR